MIDNYRERIAKIDKYTGSDDNRGMKPTGIELYRLKSQAADKDAHAIIARDYSASRMNATKWREAIDDLGDLHLQYRIRWVHVPAVSDWIDVWIPYHGSSYFDSAEVGPFRTFTIEWLEIDPFHRWVAAAKGGIVEQEQNQVEEIERRLRAINVPYEWVESNIRIVGYVRNT